MNLTSGRREGVVNAVVRADRKSIDFKPLKSYEKVFTEALMDFQQQTSQSMIRGALQLKVTTLATVGSAITGRQSS
jgi:hypothetical protein